MQHGFTSYFFVLRKNVCLKKRIWGVLKFWAIQNVFQLAVNYLLRIESKNYSEYHLNILKNV